MTSDDRAFRRAIAAAPGDAAPCLVYADWLDDRGRHDAARHWRHRGLTTGRPKKPTIPEVLDRFVAYLNAHGAWGSLHVVLDDGNVHDDHVRGCIEWATEQGDEEGRQLGEILLKMSVTQRKKLPDVAWGRSEWARLFRANGFPDIHVGPDGQTATVGEATLALGPNGLIGFASAAHTPNEYVTVPNPEPMTPDPAIKEALGGGG